MEMEGDKSVMWTGKLQCAPSAPDLRPPSAALHRAKSVIYINSAHIGQVGQVTIKYSKKLVKIIDYGVKIW